MIEYYQRPAGTSPVNGYSHATSGTGRLVAVSGQLPVDEDGNLVSTSDALAQARQVFANIGTVLRGAGAGPEHVLRFNFYVLDLADLDAVRTARDEFLAGATGPASSLVQVAGLVLPGAKLEIDALAVV